MRVLKGTLDLESQKIVIMGPHINSENQQQYIYHSPTPFDNVRFKGLLSEITIHVNNTSSLNDAEAIRFSGLALSSKIDSAA